MSEETAMTVIWRVKRGVLGRKKSHTLHSFVSLFTINYVGFCQHTNRQRANHTVSKERGGDYRAMASSQGVLSEGEKRKRVSVD